MVNTITLALALAVVALIVYAVGVERTTSAAATTASKTKSAATSTFGLAAGGAMAGLAAGDTLLQFVLSDPATLIAGLSGVLGTLGIGGVIDLSATQFALIVMGLLVGYYVLFYEVTEADD